MSEEAGAADRQQEEQEYPRNAWSALSEALLKSESTFASIARQTQELRCQFREGDLQQRFDLEVQGLRTFQQGGC